MKGNSNTVTIKKTQFCVFLKLILRCTLACGISDSKLYYTGLTLLHTSVTFWVSFLQKSSIIVSRQQTLSLESEAYIGTLTLLLVNRSLD